MQDLLDAGTIYEVDGLYCGVAEDGIEVILGHVGGEDSLARYINEYPTPADW